MKVRLVLGATALVLVAGCEHRWWADDSTPPPQPKPAASAGPASRAPTKPPPFTKTAAGPLKLAMVGGYMDAQEKDFRSRLHGVLIMRPGDDIIVSIRDDQLFKGEALSGHGRDLIQRLSGLLRHYDHSVVQVGGYTDTAAPEDANRALSQSRAKTVADTLVSDGVSKARVSSTGYGSAHPKVATGPGKNEPRNRRIEIRVIAHPEA